MCCTDVHVDSTVLLYPQLYWSRELHPIPLTTAKPIVPCNICVLFSVRTLPNAKETLEAARQKGLLVAHAPITCECTGAKNLSVGHRVAPVLLVGLESRTGLCSS